MSTPRPIYRILRLLRIIVSLSALAIVTSAASWGIMMCPWLYDCIDRAQFVPAAIRFSMGTFIVWLLITLIFGRVYCSSVCPLGTLQDIAARAMRIGPNKNKRIYRFSPPRPMIRYGMLAIMLICLVSSFWLAVSLLDPYELYVRFCTDTIAPATRAIHNAAVWTGISGKAYLPILLTTMTATILSAMLLAIVLFVAARSGRSICNTVCPVGTTLGAISRYAVWQMDIDTDLCTQCGKCEDVCKGACINLKDHIVDGSRCVMCMDCVNACADNAINYTWRRKQLSDPMMQRVVKPKTSAPVLEQTSNCIKTQRK